MKMSVETKKGNKHPVFQTRFHELRGDLSQEKFAEKIGMSRPVIGFYENGERVPDAGTLLKIAQKCGASVDWLLGLTDIKDLKSDDRAIEKRLGLSRKAIENIAQHDETQKKNISALFESSEGMETLYNIAIYLAIKISDEFVETPCIIGDDKRKKLSLSSEMVLDGLLSVITSNLKKIRDGVETSPIPTDMHASAEAGVNFSGSAKPPKKRRSKK